MRCSREPYIPSQSRAQLIFMVISTSRFRDATFAQENVSIFYKIIRTLVVIIQEHTFRC